MNQLTIFILLLLLLDSGVRLDRVRDRFEAFDPNYHMKVGSFGMDYLLVSAIDHVTSFQFDFLVNNRIILH